MNTIENNDLSRPRQTRLSWSEAFGCVSQAWSKVHNVKWAFFLATAVYVGFTLASMVIESLMEDAHLISALVSLVSSVISFLLASGILYMGIKCVDGMDVNYKQMFYPFDWSLGVRLYLFELIKWTIILGVFMIMILTPMIVRSSYSSVPDIIQLFTALIYVMSMIVLFYLISRFHLGAGFVLDERVGPCAAIKKTWKVSRGNTGKIFVLWCIQLLAILFGIITLGIGLIWMIPLRNIIYGQLYRKLQITA